MSSAAAGSGTGPAARMDQALRHAQAVFSASKDDDARGASAGVLNTKALVLNALLRTAEVVSASGSSCHDEIDSAFRSVEGVSRAADIAQARQMRSSRSVEAKASRAGLVHAQGRILPGASNSPGAESTQQRILTMENQNTITNSPRVSGASAHVRALVAASASLSAGATTSSGRYCPADRQS